MIPLAALLATALTPAAAAHQGFRALTVEYHLPAERWMLDHVIADMERGGIPAVLVVPPAAPFSPRLVEVWRKPSAHSRP